MLSKIIKPLTQYLENELIREEYASYSGLFQKLDARTKIIFTLLFIVLITIYSSFTLFFYSFILILLLVALSKVNILQFLKSTVFPIPIFSILIFLPILFTPYSPLDQKLWMISLFSWSISIYVSGVQYFLLLTSRVYLAVAVVYLLKLTTTWDDLISALEKLKFPPILISLLNLTYRYSIHFLNEAYNSFLYRESRTLRKPSLLENLRMDAVQLGTLFIKGFEKGETVYFAMVSRGYTGKHFPATDTFKFKRIDIIFIGLILIFFIVNLNSHWLTLILNGVDLSVFRGCGL